MMEVVAASKEDILWLAQRTGFAPTAGCRGISAIDAQGRLRGVVGFDGWTETSAQMHIAVEAPAAVRALLRPAFSYLFEQSRKHIALGLVPSHNAKAVAFDRHVGFREAYRIRDGWDVGDDLIIFEMRKDECRWLSHGQRRAA